MIIGIGIDLVELERMEKSRRRFGQRLARKILNPAELAEFSALPEADTTVFLASRFAAKEAGAKALGCGFSDGVGPTDLETRKDVLGKPELVLHGKAEEKGRTMGLARIHLSLTHSRNAAAAMVVMEK